MAIEEEVRMATRVRLNFICLAKIAATVVGVLFYCEFLHYYIVLAGVSLLLLVMVTVVVQAILLIPSAKLP